MDIENLIKNSNLKIPKEKIFYQEPMKNHTSFIIGGPAECLIEIEKIEELTEILKFAKQNKIPITILGNGSNVLVLDKGIKGIVLKINLQKLEIEEQGDEFLITIGAGEKMGKIAYEFCKKGITGFEPLSGIPGTIGGAIYMNAGAHGKEMKDIVKNVTVLTSEGEEKVLNCEELQFSYRSSIFAKKDWIILEAQVELQKGTQEQIKEQMKNYQDYRKEKQPIEFPSAGSTFKRGDDFITAKLIDEAGLKGYQIGGAKISERHAGFIINTGNATAQNVLDLVKYVQDEVLKKFGKKIELEIKVLEN